jgi:hypothetical protein
MDLILMMEFIYSCNILVMNFKNLFYKLFTNKFTVQVNPNHYGYIQNFCQQ